MCRTLIFVSLERGLQLPPSSQAPPIPASISPTLDNSKHQNRRSRKSERPLPTKALPVSSPSGIEASSMPSTTKLEAENASTAEKGIVQRNEEGNQSITSKPPILEASAKDVSKDGTGKGEKIVTATGQLPPASSHKVAVTATPASVTAAGAPMSMLQAAAISGVPHELGAESLQALLPGKVSHSCHVYMLFLFTRVNTTSITVFFREVITFVPTNACLPKHNIPLPLFHSSQSSMRRCRTICNYNGDNI